MSEQFLKIPYSLKNSMIWSDGRCPKVQAYIDLCMMAEYKDHYDAKSKRYMKQGHCYTTITYLAKRWKWDRQTVNRFFDDLKLSGFINVSHFPQNKGVDVEVYILCRKEEHLSLLDIHQGLVLLNTTTIYGDSIYYTTIYTTTKPVVVFGRLSQEKDAKKQDVFVVDIGNFAFVNRIDVQQGVLQFIR